jgi:hypothetical protein
MAMDPALGMIWREHLRLALLRALDDSPGGRGHESLLVDLVGAVHIAADRDQVRAELIWLADANLVVIEVVADSLVAVILEQGRRVATGLNDHAGVKRPAAGAAVGRRAITVALDRLKR